MRQRFILEIQRNIVCWEIKQMCLWSVIILNPNSNTPEPNRPHYDHLDVCVIAQQYSSATFVSLRFQMPQLKNSARCKNVITVERQLSERQSSETSNIRTHIFFVKIFSAFLF